MQVNRDNPNKNYFSPDEEKSGFSYCSSLSSKKL